MRRAVLVIAGGVALGYLAAYLADYWYVAHAPTSGYTGFADVTYPDTETLWAPPAGRPQVRPGDPGLGDQPDDPDDWRRRLWHP